MPENESEKILPKVTAGLANDVEEVKKYALPIQSGTREAACELLILTITSSPRVATNSPIKYPIQLCCYLKFETHLSNT